MSIKYTPAVNIVLSGLTTVVTNITERKVNSRYHNEADVAAFPKVVSFVVIKDKNDQNLGRTFQIKLRSVANLSVQQTIDFDKVDVVNGQATFWADQRGYVQISMKGDEIIASA